MHPCPRCGTPVIQTGTGRPRRWCSDDCRRRGQEQGIPVREIVRERTVVRPERISLDRQIARILDDPDATEQLLRALADRWRHRGPAADTEHRRFAARMLELWTAFHAPVDPVAAKNPPKRLPAIAAERRAAVEMVMSSPKSIGAVLTRVRELLDAGHIGGGADGPILSGVVTLRRYRGRL